MNLVTGGLSEFLLGADFLHNKYRSTAKFDADTGRRVVAVTLSTVSDHKICSNGHQILYKINQILNKVRHNFYKFNQIPDFVQISPKLVTFSASRSAVPWRSGSRTVTRWPTGTAGS